MSHSETKPFSGGSPLIATAPTRKRSAVRGIARASPPRRSMSRVPQACTTAPAPRKSSALKSAWFTTCNTAPEKPSTRSGRLPMVRPTSASPRPITMIPMFSTEW